MVYIRADNISIKDQLVNILGFTGHTLSLTELLNSAMVVRKQRRQCINEWVWFCANKTYLWTLKFELHIISCVMKYYYSFGTFSNHVKMQKSLLAQELYEIRWQAGFGLG